MSMGKKIEELRKKKGLSLNKLAEQSGVSKAYLWQLENNESKQPSAEILYKIASALNTTIAELLERPVKVTLDDFSSLPEGLPELISKKGDELDIREEDVRMLAPIRYRGRQPKTKEEWEYILRSIQMTLRRTNG